MRVLINAILAKRITGGSYQITQNYIRETVNHKEIEWFYIVSEQLYEDLNDFFQGKNNYVVFPIQPDFKHLLSTQKRVYKVEEDVKPDVIYSIVAPSYYRFKSDKEIMRFTHPWITHPNKYLVNILGRFGNIKLYLYTFTKVWMMKKCKYFITQSETAKKGICRIIKIKEEFVDVEPNTLPRAYQGIIPNWDKDYSILNIAYVAAPNKGKNHMIIPDFIKELSDNYGMRVNVYTTIPDNSPMLDMMNSRAKELGVSSQLINVGYMKQIQLVDLYKKCNYCFFPSVMEVFSATLLEAMYFHLPVLASDFSFNSDVCKDSAVYFEPMNYKDAAKQFASFAGNKAIIEEMLEKQDLYIKEYLDFSVYFKKSLEFFNKISKL